MCLVKNELDSIQRVSSTLIRENYFVHVVTLLSIIPGKELSTDT